MPEEAPLELDGLGAIRIAACKAEVSLNDPGRRVELLNPDGIRGGPRGDISHQPARKPLAVILLQVAGERETPDGRPARDDEVERGPLAGPHLLSGYLEVTSGGVVEGHDGIREIRAFPHGLIDPGCDAAEHIRRFGRQAVTARERGNRRDRRKSAVSRRRVEAAFAA